LKKENSPFFVVGIIRYGLSNQYTVIAPKLLIFITQLEYEIWPYEYIRIHFFLCFCWFINATTNFSTVCQLIERKDAVIISKKNLGFVFISTHSSNATKISEKLTYGLFG
jgi:hypothetical protein